MGRASSPRRHKGSRCPSLGSCLFSSLVFVHIGFCFVGADLQRALEARLAEIDQALASLPVASIATGDAPGTSENLTIVVGTSRLAEEIPGLELRLSEIIGDAYRKSLADLPSRAQTYKQQSAEEVRARLAWGDLGPRANRVLHVALLSGADGRRTPVGCVSSTFRTTWTPPGCGHWGLLVVDVAAQGLGLGSKLVKAAEHRLAGECDRTQIEYTYSPEHAYSDRLKAWYEGKLNFTVVHVDMQGEHQFRSLQKPMSPEQRQVAQRERLLEWRASLVGELARARESGMSSRGRRWLTFVSETAPLVERAWLPDPAAAVSFQFFVYDAPAVESDATFGVEDKEAHFVVDLRSSRRVVRFGRDSTADCVVQASDDNLYPWVDGALDPFEAFMSGKLAFAGSGCHHAEKLRAFLQHLRRGSTGSTFRAEDGPRSDHEKVAVWSFYLRAYFAGALSAIGAVVVASCCCRSCPTTAGTIAALIALWLAVSTK